MEDEIIDVDINEDEDIEPSAPMELDADDLENIYINNFKSKSKYVKQSQIYEQWKRDNNIHIDNNSEDVVVKYFKFKMDSGVKTATLWSYRSMLNPYFVAKYKINLNDYHQATYLLKSGKRKKEKPIRKAATFEEEHLKEFLEIDSDEPETIRDKVMFAISWFCFPRGSELVQLTFENLKWNKDGYLDVDLERAKTNDITEHKMPPILFNKFDSKVLVKRYTDLIENKSGRFFRRFRKDNKRFSNEPLGHKQVPKIATKIATTLGLREPKQYTGHSFRRSSITNIAKNGASVPLMMKAGNYASLKTAMGYVDATGASNRQIADLANGGQWKPASQNTEVSTSTSIRPSTFNFSNCGSVTINNFYSSDPQLPPKASIAPPTLHSPIKSQKKSVPSSPVATRLTRKLVASASPSQIFCADPPFKPPTSPDMASTPKKDITLSKIDNSVEDDANWSLGLNVTADAIVTAHGLDQPPSPPYNLRKRKQSGNNDERSTKRRAKKT
jgi:site-specific recombinase XerD